MIRVFKMSALVAMSCFLGSAQYAHADAVGTIVEDVTDATAQGMGLEVCNVYAEFDDASDYLLYLAFSDIKTNDPAGFWHHQFGSDKAPSQVLVDMFPDLAYDTFVTLGWEVVPTGEADNTTVDPNWNSFQFNNNGMTRGGWYNSNPSNAQSVDPSRRCRRC